MVAVAVLAVLIGAEVLRRRRAFYLERANVAAGWATWLRDPARHDLWLSIEHESAPSEAIRQSDFYAGVRRKYERAASAPWWPIPPDPPSPIALSIDRHTALYQAADSEGRYAEAVRELERLMDVYTVSPYEGSTDGALWCLDVALLTCSRVPPAERYEIASRLWRKAKILRDGYAILGPESRAAETKGLEARARTLLNEAEPRRPTPDQIDLPGDKDPSLFDTGASEGPRDDRSPPPD